MNIKDTLKDENDTMIWRRVSFPFVKFFYKIGASANDVTWLSVVLVLVASAMISMDFYMPIAGFLIILFNIFDYVDGSLARLNGTVSNYGSWTARNAHALFSIITRIALSLWMGFSSPILILFSMLLFAEIFLSTTFSLTFSLMSEQNRFGKIKKRAFVPTPKKFRRRKSYIFSHEFMILLFFISMLVSPWIIIAYFIFPKNLRVIQKWFSMSRVMRA